MPEPDLPQVWITWTETHHPDRHAASALLPALEHGPVTDWWFLRKHPHWRLRYTGGPHTRTHLDQALTHLYRQGVVTSWHHGIYEPEHHAFGGRAAMRVIHRLAHAESRYLLHLFTRAEEPPQLGVREQAVLFSSVFLRAAGLDWYEQGDVWARVADLRHRPEPAPADAALTEQVRTLMTLHPQPLTTRGLLGDGADTWTEELTRAGHDLAHLYRTGLLTRGLRAVCAHALIFSFNRWGLTHLDQHILSNTARKATMTDTTTPTPEQIDHARQAFVDQLRAGGHITDPAIEAAFRTVPRHLFIPNATLEDAYANRVVSIKDDENGTSLSCASQPGIVAMMLHQARIEPGMRVLELGTGTGYNAALIGHLAGPTGHVVTIDVDADLTDNATARLKDAGTTNVQVVLGDGALGHQDGAPYDLIIATVGCHRVPTAWVTQLAQGGRLIAPVRIAGDVSRSIAFKRDGEKWVSVGSELSTFMPLRDSVDDDTRTYVPVTDDGTVLIQANQEQHITPHQVTGVLDEPARTVWTGVSVGGTEPRDGLWLHLALHLANSLSRMTAERSVIDAGTLTPGLPWGDMASVPVRDRGLAYLTSRKDPAGNTWEIGVIGHSPAGHDLAEHMAAQITAWNRDEEPHFELALDSDGHTLLAPIYG